MGSKTILPILIEGETIYIGPITGDEIIFCDFIKRLGANDIAIKEKIKMSKEDKEEAILFNRKIIIDNMNKIKSSASKLLEEKYENEVWIIEKGQMKRHTFQPFVKQKKQRKQDLLNVVDEKVGIVTEVKIESLKELGVDIYVAVSTTTDYSIYDNSMFAQSNSGAGFDYISAMYAAVGESIERLAAGCYSPEKVRLSKACELDEPIVKIEEFVLFSHEQYAKENFPYRKLDKDTVICWSKAYNLCTDKSAYMPLSFIKLPYKIQEKEDRISPSISTGLALGKTKNQAILTGIYEVIERDAFAISWLLKLPPNKELKLTEYLKCEELILSKKYKCRAFDISIQGLLNTVVVTIHDNETNHFMIGSATRFTIAEAIKKAFLEAAQGIKYVDMLVCKYRDQNLISDFNKIDSFQKHASFYSIYPKMRKQVGYFLDETYKFNERRNSQFGENEKDILSDEEKLKIVIQIMKDRNRDIYYVDMTTPELENFGVSAARVIIPGMQPLHGVHRYRFLSDKRLREVEEKININPYPHPFP